MLLDGMSLSEAIRARKKKMLGESDNDSIGATVSSPSEAYDAVQADGIEDTLDSPALSNASDAPVKDGVGLSEPEKARMARLRTMLSTLKLNG